MNKPLFIITVTFGLFLTACGGGASTAGAGSSDGTGLGGSIARFTANGDYLYTISDDELHAYSIEDPADPKFKSKFRTFSAETLMTYSQNDTDFLLVGKESGMEIYDLSNFDSENGSNTFEFVSYQNHLRSCDPIVAKDGFAFQTLRSQFSCDRGEVNALNIVDIRDIDNPQTVLELDLIGPYGLSIDQDNNLFVCDGRAGLRNYQVNFEALESGNFQNDSDVITEKTQNHIDTYQCLDLISTNYILTGLADEGIRQFDYGTGKLEEISFIPSTQSIE